MNWDRRSCVNCCSEPIGSIYVCCADCPPGVILCLSCFSCGAEPSGLPELGSGQQLLPSHQASHRYHLRNCGGPTVFGAGSDDSAPLWSGKEEFLLLESVEMFSAGNWASVRDRLNDSAVDHQISLWHTEEEIRRHFHNFYVEGRVGVATVQSGAIPLRSIGTVNIARVVDHTVDSASSSQVGPVGSVVEVPSGLEELAFMPKRNEFEREWHDGVERLLNSQVVLPDDEEIDRQVRVTIVDVYRRILMERNRRKDVSRRLHLMTAFLEVEKTVDANSPPPKFKTFRQRLKFAARFLSTAEFDDLVKSLQAGKKLKRTVSCLQRYRINGITSVQDANKFEMDSLRRGKRKGKMTAAATTIPSPQPVMPRTSKSAGEESPMTPVKPIPQEIGSSSSENRQNPQDLMSPMEKSFCAQHSLKPADYLMLKMSSLRDFALKQTGRPMKNSFLSRWNENDNRQLVEDFLRRAGIIFC